MKKQIKPIIKLKEALKKPSIVSEAFFQILTLIISTFSFAFLIAMASVAAVPTATAATPACCEKIKDTGLFCQNAMSDSCDTAFKSAPTSCESTSFCKLGCCYDSVEGTCAENTPRKLCDLRNGTFDTNADCKIAQCAQGCCILGSEASLTTLVRCKKLASYYGLETDFRSGITNEADCIAIAQAQDKGACVITTPTETTCKFTVRSECNSMTHNASAFYKDFLCSAEQLATNCARQHHTGCIEGKDEVYWFDSCNNPENIYDSDKTRSYNNGKVLSKEQSCNSASANIQNTECGNCNYFTGSMCGQARAGIEPKPRYGDYICRDLNCHKTYNGKDYKHGESWCVYDGAVGEGRDIVGSRHWRHICVNGEEKLEPCDDYRQGICVEGTTNVGNQIFTESVCRANNWRDCLDKRDASSCNKAVNCYWRDLWQGGICLPDVPTGFNLKTSGGGSVASSICNIANAQCAVVYEKKFGGWQCVQNCECEKSSWTENMLKACTSLGDCGAKANIAGKLTKDGYSISGGSDVSSGFFDTYTKIAMSKTSSIKGGTEEFASNSANAQQSAEAQEGGVQESGGDMWGTVGTVALTAGGLMHKQLTAGLTKLVSMPHAGMAWNVGINFAAAMIASKMVSSMFGLKGQAASMVSYAGMAAATAMSAWSFFGTSAIGTAGTTVGAAGATIGAGGAIVGAGGAVAGAGGATVISATGATTAIAAGGAIPAGASVAAGSSVASGSSLASGTLTSAPAFLPALIIIIAVIIIMALIMKFMGIGKTKVKIVSFTCMPWQPPTGGKDCEKCNGDEMKPCTEYRCSSLGATCSLLNEGTGKETCVALNPNDVNAPKIKPFESVLTAGHTYNDVQPCPPGPGCWKIARTGAADSCIKAFTPLTFGVETDEPAQCKIDYNHTASFDEMQFWLGDNIYLYNHSMQMSLPGPEHINAQSPEIQNDGKYTLYIRCRDGNGNANTAEMAMQFCVEPGPDTTPAWIMRTSIDNGAPVAYGTRNAALDLFLNEPTECKWSRTDQAYENMNSSFDCTTNLYQMEWDMTYKCSGTLTGIQDKVDNTYYFRCKDQPWLVGTANETDRNANKESYVFILKGTIPLNITKSEPTGTIIYGSEPIPATLKIETADGYNYGEAKCYFSASGYNDMIEFFETGSYEHEQVLNLPESANNTYYILCRDLGGNTDKTVINFKTEVDKIPPKIIRVYQDAGMLKIVTDETSDCVYSVKDCNYDFTSATEMPFTLSSEHTAEWRTDITYYIKCMDAFGNMPAPSECSMQVNAYDVPIG